MMDVKLDMSGFEARRKALAKAPLVVSKQAVSSGTMELRDALRADTARAFGKEMAYAWGGDVFPRGTKLANNPAGLVYARAERIVESFEYGATIQAGRAGALYIPIKGSPADKASQGKRRNRKVSLVAEMIRKFGRPLELPQKDGSGWLLLFKTRTSQKTGRISSAYVNSRKTGERTAVTRGVVWTPMFVVEPQVTLARRLNARALIERFAAKWPDSYTEQLARELAKA
ncbi:hypothetical protein MCERH10_02828 [Caulobacteraceae bacterium]